MLGNCTVSDVARAENWYARVFGRAPDARPMDGLIEWHLAPGFGVQVFADPERAGHSTVVLEVAGLDAQAERLLASGIEHQGPQPGGGARIPQLQDLDGNRVVLASPAGGTFALSLAPGAQACSATQSKDHGSSSPIAMLRAPAGVWTMTRSRG